MRNDIEAFFNPRSVAIIGATPKEGKVGRVIVENFKRRFKGKIYPINPKYNEILGLKCYPSVKDAPENIDLAVIVVPAPIVPRVLRDCGEKGVKATIIISGGFRETGTEEGRRLEEEVVKIARDYGIRVIGPNCIGIYDNWSGVDTFFLPDKKMKRPPRGGISFISQSGAFASALLDWMAYNDIGVSRAISYGNKIDVDDVDLVEYLGRDDKTRLIIMYIEGIKDGRGKLFMEKIREVVKNKPVIVYKAGKTARGSKAAASHTAALAGNYDIYRAAFKQVGIVEAESFDEIGDFAKILLTQPLMKGKRVFVVTDAGGIGVMLTDALTKQGFELPVTPDDLKKELREVLPPYCIVENPIDLTGDADDERFKIILEKVLPKPYVDAVVLGALPQIPGMTYRFIDYTVNVWNKYRKPLLVINIGSEEAVKFKVELENKGIPVYESPERAARALKALYIYSKHVLRGGI